MNRAIAVATAAALGFVLAGCKTGEITEADTQQMRREFSDQNYKDNMYKAGKGAEYEAEKKRQEAEGGGQDQGQ